MNKMDLDSELLITERKGELTMGRKHKQRMHSSYRRRTLLSSLILTLAMVGLILVLKRLFIGRPLQLTNVQFKFFETSQDEAQLSKVDFMAQGKDNMIIWIQKQ